ncbi:cytoplasmic protein [Bacillus canaveralius]|uniref:Cytoplasmic protein n=1 Tax=Bacillus canaveralius TaxID=1403243 RepID=A0A2N5GPY9_9BACI|nr:metal-sensitive transcriptional regulator [Bacillus canaveralius]PLR84903.1 cytoplasmic protein [Bacillus canaveralius]PLR95805.1 cytoplasmic protein [Bacillus canaveralius]
MHYANDIKNRLRKIEGQARGVLGLMEAEKDCRDVVNQLSAIRSAADKALAYIVALNLLECMQQGGDAGNDSSVIVKEAVNLLVKSR